MSEEVFEMICAMDRRNIELQIALQCAPCVAGLKTSNLLIVPREDEMKVRQILKFTRLLNYKLAYDRNRVIFLVFNRDMLSNYLGEKCILSYLKETGYDDCSFGYILRTFQGRYESYINGRASFPHEMGLLLGYPLEDVVGFIENHGQNFKLSGYWKVYSNENSARKLFSEFDKTKDDIVIRVSNGQSIKEILDLYQNKKLQNKEAV